MTPLLVYVAGPYRAPNAWEVEQNIRAAEAVGMIVLSCGAYPIIPHANTRGYCDGQSDAFMLAATLELMRRCDAVALVDGWKRSAGARGEYEEAVRLSLPVFREGEIRSRMYEWLRVGKAP